MSTPLALEVKHFSGKCQGCERTLTEALAPSLSNCLCASPRIPPLGALLDAGARGGRSPIRWPPDPAKMWQPRSAGTAPAASQQLPPAGGACQPCRKRSRFCLRIRNSNKKQQRQGMFASRPVCECKSVATC